MRIKVVLFGLVGLWAQLMVAQNSCVLYPTMKQLKVLNLNINGAGGVKGLLAWLPSDYYSSSKKYPVIIAVHGVGETGSGSDADLCRLLGENSWGNNPWFGLMAAKIERNEIPSSVTDQHGQQFSYIIISPQMQYFGNPGEMDSFLDYLLANFRIEPTRVYLTGLSAGSDYIMNYVGSSVARARRIAAVNPVAACSGLSGGAAKNIVDAKTAYWGVQCQGDNTCTPDGSNPSVTWVNLMANIINTQNPPPYPVAWHSSLPQGYECPDPRWNHDVWSKSYDPIFRQSINGRNVNLYEWFIQFTQASAQSIVPVKMKNYEVTLNKGRVHVRWTTTFESNTSEFIIQRAGSSMQFSTAAAVKAAGNSTTERQYEWIDERPLSNLSYYRLQQTDLDGRNELYEIKKILNKKTSYRLLISPNPFVNRLTAFVQLDRPQKVTISISDLSGRRLKSETRMQAEGSGEISLLTTDLSIGVYLVRIDGEDFSEIQKIVKQ